MQAISLHLDLESYESIERLLAEIEESAPERQKIEVFLKDVPKDLYKITYPSRRRTIAKTILQIAQNSERVTIRNV